MAYTKSSQQVKDLLASFGGANFADILNRLWMNGLPVDRLQAALATTSSGTNDPSDIIARLLNSGVATIDQIKAAPTSYVPPDPASIQWPFSPTNVQNGVVVPVSTAPPPSQPSQFGDPVPNPGTAPYIYRGDLHPAATPTPAASLTPLTTPTAASRTPIVTQRVPTGPAPAKAPVTDAEIQAYQAEHFGSMLWVHAVPSLDKLLRDAATGQWSPARFNAELEGTDWWKQNSDTMRLFTERMARDSETVKKELGTSANLFKVTASSLGITLNDDEALQLATDQAKFGWDATQTKQALLGHAHFNANQEGGLGAFETRAKSLGKDYLINMTDEESFQWATKLATGEATEANITESLATRAKASYPTIAQFIESGGTPKNFFSQQISTAAQLLEVDQSNIDLTDPKFHDIVSHADDKGNIRPMTLSETAKFVKSKDEYWKTGNSANEVSSVVSSLGQMFGKAAM